MESAAADRGADGAEPEIWALSDGRAGNARQARALAGALAARLGWRMVEKTAAPAAPFDRAPAWAWAMAGARRGGWPFTGLADRGAALAEPWPAAVIGAGRRVAPVAAAMRRLGGVFAAQVLAPQMRADAFDAVVAPGHDGLGAPNAIETLGALNEFDDAALAAAADAWARRLGHAPSPRVAVLIGGPSGSARFGRKATAALCDGLTRLAVDGAGLMVTPSRRTPRAVVDAVADAVGGLGAWIWPGVGDNPYPAVLGLADAVVVTADSVSMACEAAATGKPLFVSPVDRLSGRLAQFHAALSAQGIARPFDGQLARWRYPPLREADRVAGLLADRLRAGAPDARRLEPGRRSLN